jgi:hypothetical protein
MRLSPSARKLANAIREDIAKMRESITSLGAVKIDIQQLINANRDEGTRERQQERERQGHYRDITDRILIAERDIQEHKHRDEQTYGNLHLWVQGILAVGTWFAFLAAFYYAGVATYQLREMTKAANAAERAATVAHEALVITQRQLSANFSFAPSVRFDRPGIQLLLKNSGQMDAVITSWTSDLEIQSIVNGRLAQHDVKSWTVDSSIGPASGGGISRLHPIEPAVNDSAQLEEYLGKQIITVKVRIVYDSGFGESREQSFCRVLVADEVPNGKGHALYFEPPVCGEDAAFYIRARRLQLGLSPHIQFKTP